VNCSELNETALFRATVNYLRHNKFETEDSIIKSLSRVQANGHLRKDRPLYYLQNVLEKVVNEKVTGLHINKNRFLFYRKRARGFHFAVPWFRRVVAGFPPRRSGFQPVLSHTGSLVVRAEYFGFSCHSFIPLNAPHYSPSINALV
jgi:hypothetical protein